MEFLPITCMLVGNNLDGVLIGLINADVQNLERDFKSAIASISSNLVQNIRIFDRVPIGTIRTYSALVSIVVMQKILQCCDNRTPNSRVLETPTKADII